MLPNFIQQIRKTAELRRPRFANENWRPYPAKHTRVKVIGGNGVYSLAMKIERPGRPNYAKVDPYINNQFSVIPYARFSTFYDAMVGAKTFLDWLMEPYAGPNSSPRKESRAIPSGMRSSLSTVGIAATGASTTWTNSISLSARTPEKMQSGACWNSAPIPGQ